MTTEPATLSQAIQKEALARFQQFMDGLQHYQHAPKPERVTPDCPMVWREGDSRLFDYSKGQGEVCVLAVPSLINRSYILDLAPERSMMDYLADVSQPYLLDWGEPAKEPEALSLNNYIVRLERAIESVVEREGKPVVLLGYCMGGLLSLAVAARRPELVQGLTLLAVPWDFDAASEVHGKLDEETLLKITQLFDPLTILPQQFVQSWFYLLQPWAVQKKYARFADLQPGSRAAQEFVEVEQWINDGVPMSAEVARECILDWVGKNVTGRGVWEVDGVQIDPARIDIPALVMVPKRDMIVPPMSAEPLGHVLPQAEMIHVPAGHVSMVVGKRAQKICWGPLAEWLKKL